MQACSAGGLSRADGAVGQRGVRFADAVGASVYKLLLHTEDIKSDPYIAINVPWQAPPTAAAERDRQPLAYSHAAAAAPSDHVAEGRSRAGGTATPRALTRVFFLPRRSLYQAIPAYLFLHFLFSKGRTMRVVSIIMPALSVTCVVSCFAILCERTPAEQGGARS